MSEYTEFIYGDGDVYTLKFQLYLGTLSEFNQLYDFPHFIHLHALFIECHNSYVTNES